MGIYTQITNFQHDICRKRSENILDIDKHLWCGKMYYVYNLDNGQIFRAVLFGNSFCLSYDAYADNKGPLSLSFFIHHRTLRRLSLLKTLSQHSSNNELVLAC
jgi:hypothetical protein